jgi:hypothetical protein
MDATSPIIPQPPTVWWPTPEPKRLSRDQNRQAHRLGLYLGALVAVGWEALSVGAIAVFGHFDTDGIDIGGWIGFGLVSVIAIAAGASMGWCLGPRATLTARADRAITVVVMAISTMLLGDALVVTAIGVVGAVVGAGTGAADIPLGMAYSFAIGAMVLGPFVILFAILPASIAWLALFSVRWRRSSEA